MNLKINCKQNDRGAWCTDKRVKRSLFGIGARCCLEFDDKSCPYKEEYPRPTAPPFPPRIQTEVVR